MSKSSRACPQLPGVFGYADACALAEAYAKGEACPVDVTKKCLAEASKPQYKGVYISMTEERALMEAEASKARYAKGLPLSPLDGVPLGWKDLYDIKGTVTTAGSDLWRNNPPAKQDGPLVINASRAGMICPGKLNTTEFAYSSTGTNPHFGNPVNPYSKEGQPRIPGGSSCGSGVAVGSGILPIAIGSDTGGSIRIPSAFNGLTGFKPTVGWYDRGGLAFLARTLDTPGPMGRSMRDIVVIDRILRGKPCMCGNPKPIPLKGRRFVIEKSMLSDEKIVPEVKAMLEEVGKRLERAGAFVQTRDVLPFQEALKTIGQGWFSGAECFNALRFALDDPEKAKRIDQRIRKRAEGSRNLDPSLIVNSRFKREDLIPAFRKDLNGDIMIMPSVGHGAPLLNELLEKEDVFFHYIVANTRLTMPCNLLNAPGVTLPAGVDNNGMPISVCLYGATGDDEKVLEAALAAEEAIIHK